MSKVAVTSKSFSKNEFLKSETLKKYPETKFNVDGIQLKGDALVEYLKDAEMAIVALEKIDATLLDQLPKLKHISKYGVGIDNIDLPALYERGVTLSWEGGVNKRSVAELTLCFLINLLRKVSECHQRVLNENWKVHIGQGVEEVTIGLLGFGHVGQEVARILQPFNSQILIYDYQDRTKEALQFSNVKQVELKQLQAQADIISVHLPKTSKTINLINKEFFKNIKNGGALINTARGGIVNEADLHEALASEKISAAAMDVFETEPPGKSPLLSLENFICTPHIGGSSQQAVKAMGLAAINGLANKKEAKWENFFNYPQ